jgi:tetratricopeptide (TPR) repeat protein
VSPSPDAPHNPHAYELYLRANELSRNFGGIIEARDLYQRALELDPAFAPAWAQLGRCHRVIGKFITVSADSEAQAENALQRALDLNPRLSIAHKFYAYLEADMGQAQRAIVRLLTQASRRGNDPELFAGLVQACRYCGLYEESIAAHEEARRLDPNVSTSLEQTLLLAGDIDRLLSVEPPPVASGDQGIRIIGLGLAGRRDQARQLLTQMQELTQVPIFQSWVSHLRSWLDGSVEDIFAHFAAFDGLQIQQDPEAIFQEGWLFCDVGEHERGLEFLERAVAKGYYVAPTLIQRPQFDALRNDPRFRALLSRAEAGRDEALAAFRGAGGDRLLGR